jgi:hypothetical protein
VTMRGSRTTTTGRASAGRRRPTPPPTRSSGRTLRPFRPAAR